MSNSKIIPSMGRNNCGGRCRILVEEKDGKVISIKGDPKYPDKIPCIRGLNYHKTFLGNDRLTTLISAAESILKAIEQRFLETGFERAKTIVNAYSMLAPSVEAFVQAACGDIGFTAFSPVKIRRFAFEQPFINA